MVIFTNRSCIFTFPFWSVLYSSEKQWPFFYVYIVKTWIVFYFSQYIYEYYLDKTSDCFRIWHYDGTPLTWKLTFKVIQWSDSQFDFRSFSWFLVKLITPSHVKHTTYFIIFMFHFYLFYTDLFGYENYLPFVFIQY